ncbi:hypothetical protein [Ferrovibrio sp.]|uniref:hypothetical protein n=1 Tax=Ferrovibrio sp. TaxID=1917215 RepID=UPI0031204E52
MDDDTSGDRLRAQAPRPTLRVIGGLDTTLDSPVLGRNEAGLMALGYRLGCEAAARIHPSKRLGKRRRPAAAHLRLVVGV